MRTARNAFGIVKEEIIGVFTVFFTLWEVCGVLSGATDLRKLVFAGLLFAAALCVIIYLFGLKKAISGNISIPLCGRTVTLLQDDYQENMVRLMEKTGEEEAKKTLYIMGIDMSGDLSISTEKGILHDVIPLLDRDFVHFMPGDASSKKTPSEEIRAQIDEYLAKKQKEQKADRTESGLAFGECVRIDLTLKRRNQPDGKTYYCNLLMVANSKKIHEGDEKQKEKVEDLGKSYIVIPGALDYANGSGCSQVMIGVMGTNGMAQPYQVMFSQIINQFARIAIKDEHPEDLRQVYISIRESDYSRWKANLSQLEAYAQTCSRFYNKP